MKTYSKRVVLVIRAEDRAKANRLAKRFDPIGGEKTFTVGLSANGEKPPTHYWCSTQLKASTWQMVQAMQASFPGSVFTEMADVRAKVEVILVAKGIRRMAAEAAGKVDSRVS